MKRPTVLSLLGVVLLFGCVQQKSLASLDTAMASGDNERVLTLLLQIEDDYDDYPSGEVEKLLLVLSESSDVQIADASYRIAAQKRLPAFVEIYEKMQVSSDAGERAIVAFHPMSLDQSLAMLEDKDRAVQNLAMMGAHSLKSDDVTPIVRKGLEQRFTGSMVQYEAIRLANVRGITSVAQQIVGLLRQRKGEGVDDSLLGEQIFYYVRSNKLAEYYDEVAPYKRGE